MSLENWVRAAGAVAAIARLIGSLSDWARWKAKEKRARHARKTR